NPTGPSTTTAPNCKDGWKAFNGYCYFVQNFTLGSDGLWASWTPDDAQEQCQMRASNLVASYNVLDQTQHVPSGTGSCGYAEAWIGLRAYPDNTPHGWMGLQLTIHITSIFQSTTRQWLGG
ncbi:unnamed protein product, partial [Mesorhabditis belari]